VGQFEKELEELRENEHFSGADERDGEPSWVRSVAARALFMWAYRLVREPYRAYS
jgi:hypothetical protein